MSHIRRHVYLLIFHVSAVHGGPAINGRRPSQIHSLSLVIVAAPTALGRSLLFSFCTVVIIGIPSDKVTIQAGRIAVQLNAKRVVNTKLDHATNKCTACRLVIKH
jgi:hypothetical protein